MRILITGGGTGGHLAIAKSIALVLRKKGATLYFIGSSNGQDQLWFKDEELFCERFFLATRGVVNNRGIGRIKSLFLMLMAFLQARKIIKNIKVDRVFSVGGYSAAPSSFAALSMGIPLFIHEQNATMGTLNRILKPFASAFFSSYDSASQLRNYPVRDEFFMHARIRQRDVREVLFLGGSQGANAINRLALKLAPLLSERGISITHQCGERELEKVRQQYKELGIEAEVFSFSPNLTLFMQRADIAVSRAGASTLWELCANGLPALFIPYPYAASDHQYHNAKFIIDKNLGWLLRQEELEDEVRVKALFTEILASDIQEKSQMLIKVIKSNGAEEIADFILT